MGIGDERDRYLAAGNRWRDRGEPLREPAVADRSSATVSHADLQASTATVIGATRLAPAFTVGIHRRLRTP